MYCADRHAISACLAALQGGQADTPFIDQLLGSEYREPLQLARLGPNPRPRHHMSADPDQRSQAALLLWEEHLANVVAGKVKAITRLQGPLEVVTEFA